MAKKPRPLSLVPEFDPARPRYFEMDYDYNIAFPITLLNKAEVFPPSMKMEDPFNLIW